jgi:hypothetical protein
VVSQGADGTWFIKPTPDMRATDMLRGVEALNRELAGGPGEAIAAALMELIAVTSRPPQMDDVMAAAYMETMPKAMWEYPIDVVRGACARWRLVPNAGNWWPTEQQLREQCETLFKSRRDLRAEAMRVLRRLESQEEGVKRGRSFAPYGRTEKYVNACREAFGPGFVYSYLSNRTCDFTDTTIYTIGLSVERLTQRSSALLTQFGVTLKQCPDTTRRFYDEEDARAVFDAPAPKKKWK